jgi:hypothetical protein
MRTFYEDYTAGTNSESEIMSALEEAFDTKLTKTSKFHRMDFEGDSCWIEVKTRFGVASTTYPTMLIPESKITFALTATKPVYFVFCLTDGIFYCQFDKAKFETYKQEGVCRYDRGEKVAVRHLHIPCSDLDWCIKYTAQN